MTEDEFQAQLTELIIRAAGLGCAAVGGTLLACAAGIALANNVSKERFEMLAGASWNCAVSAVQQASVREAGG